MEVELPVKYDELSGSDRRLVREQYIGQQKNLCYHCKSSLSDKPPRAIMKQRVTKRLFPPNFFKWPLHLHHSHDTGMTLGTVHAYCNAVLWEHHNE